MIFPLETLCMNPKKSFDMYHVWLVPCHIVNVPTLNSNSDMYHCAILAASFSKSGKNLNFLKCFQVVVLFPVNKFKLALWCKKCNFYIFLFRTQFMFCGLVEKHKLHLQYRFSCLSTIVKNYIICSVSVNQSASWIK